MAGFPGFDQTIMELKDDEGWVDAISVGDMNDRLVGKCYILRSPNPLMCVTAKACISRWIVGFLRDPYLDVYRTVFNDTGVV